MTSDHSDGSLSAADVFSALGVPLTIAAVEALETSPGEELPESGDDLPVQSPRLMQVQQTQLPRHAHGAASMSSHLSLPLASLPPCSQTRLSQCCSLALYLSAETDAPAAPTRHFTLDQWTSQIRTARQQMDAGESRSKAALSATYNSVAHPT